MFDNKISFIFFHGLSLARFTRVFESETFLDKSIALLIVQMVADVILWLTDTFGSKFRSILVGRSNEISRAIW